MRTLREATLSDKHKDLGNTTHSRDGAVLKKPHSLRIMIAENGDYYLIYLDERGSEQTDTWHESLESAIQQAEFEFGVKPDEWKVVSS